LDWLERTGWSIARLLRGVRIAITSDVVSEHLLRRWLGEGYEIQAHALSGLIQFVRTYPEPGDFAAFEDRVAKSSRQRTLNEEQSLAERRQEVERERQRRVAELLAAERAPRARTGIFPSRKMLGGQP